MTSVIKNGEPSVFAPELLDVAQIRRSVKALIRRLIVITQNLDLLPENRYLTIRLYHTSDTPEKWAPPMFAPSGRPLWFDRQTFNTLGDEVFGTMETGVHSVQVRVTSAKRCVPDTSEQGGSISEGICPTKKSRKANAITADSFIGFNSHLDGSYAHTTEDDQITPMNKFFLGSPSTATLELESSRDLIPKCRDLTSLVEMPQGRNPNIQTSRILNQHPPTCVDSPLRIHLSAPNQKSNVSTRGVSVVSGNSSQKFLLIEDNCTSRGGLVRAKRQDIVPVTSHIETQITQNSISIHQDHQQPKLKLRKNEAHLLQQMRTFALARRLIRYLMRSKVAKSLYDIKKALGISQDQRIIAIISVLAEKSFISTSNSRKVATKRSPDKYKIVEVKAVLRSIEQELLDPLINISHHYELPDSSFRMTRLERPKATIPELEAAYERVAKTTNSRRQLPDM
ncbi:hypothetical protein ABW20_dc0107588 [Dactylellina cionopaga]|nr:hypothetical protein ABW20_dc0107588 [Dactylellina cionopaga]